MKTKNLVKQIKYIDSPLFNWEVIKPMADLYYHYNKLSKFKLYYQYIFQMQKSIDIIKEHFTEDDFKKYFLPKPNFKYKAVKKAFDFNKAVFIGYTYRDNEISPVFIRCDISDKQYAYINGFMVGTLNINSPYSYMTEDYKQLNMINPYLIPFCDDRSTDDTMSIKKSLLKFSENAKNYLNNL